MSVDSTISMALTLHGDATVEARSNAVATSIRNMGSAYMGYVKHARHSRYTMSGINFLTGGMLGRVGARMREEFGKIETGLGRTLEELGSLIGGGIGYEAARSLPSVLRRPDASAAVERVSAAKATTAATKAVAASRAASAALGATRGALTGMMAAIGGFVVASASAVVVAMLAGYVAGRLGDYISQEVERQTTGGTFKLDAVPRGRFATMTKARRQRFAQEQRDRAMEQAGVGVVPRGTNRFIDAVERRVDLLAARVRNQESQLQTQLSELRESVRQGQLVTEREQRAMTRAVRSLGRL